MSVLRALVMATSSQSLDRFSASFKSKWVEETDYSESPYWGQHLVSQSLSSEYWARSHLVEIRRCRSQYSRALQKSEKKWFSLLDLEKGVKLIFWFNTWIVLVVLAALGTPGLVLVNFRELLMTLIYINSNISIFIFVSKMMMII